MRALALGCLLAFVPIAHSAESPCAFDREARSFSGSPQEQSQCLLRNVSLFGRLGAARALPDSLARKIGGTDIVDSASLASFLARHDIPEATVGGAIDEPLSSIPDADGLAITARYFVIHDTSTPNLTTASLFPSSINEPTWSGNALGRWDRGSASVAHAFVNRAGESISPIPFGTASLGTKFEKQWTVDGAYPLRGLFLHVELVQPRRSRPPSTTNDALAPDPGFTQAQYKRLALLYVVASHRAGRWLIPAFHAAVDAGLPDAHDDPQNFSLDEWAEAVDVLATDIGLREEIQ